MGISPSWMSRPGLHASADIIQVMLYMYGLGRYVTAWGDITLKGRVVYSDHVVDIPADAISPEFIEEMGSLIRRVANSKPVVAVPSRTECGSWPITLADCPQRVSVPAGSGCGGGVLKGGFAPKKPSTDIPR